MSSTEDVGVSKLQTNCTNTGVPVLAYGLYKVPCGDEGAKIISNAISAGYRHFDGARIYGKSFQSLRSHIALLWHFPTLSFIGSL